MGDEESTTTEVSRREAIVARLSKQLDTALEKLAEAPDFAKPNYQTDLFQVVETMMESDAGMKAVSDRAHRFEECGVFDGGPWEHAVRLQPPLVAGSLKAVGVYPVVEVLSELRMLAIAEGRSQNESVSAEDARDFLDEVLALNLEYLFPGDTEQERIEGGPRREFAVRLFSVLADHLSLQSLRSSVIYEIEQICAQRPILTKRVRRMIELAVRIPDDESAPETDSELRRYVAAVAGDSPLATECRSIADYREKLMQLESADLATEARSLAESMQRTGLTSLHHAVLLRRLRKVEPGLLPVALGLNEVGTAELAQNEELVQKLLRVAILPSTSQSIYGFAKVLERGVFSRPEVQAGLERLVTLDLRSDVRRNLLAQREMHDGATANSILLAGAISVLGQPLGIGQGYNPTCQAARALSLWSQHAPAHLLDLLITAARDGLVEFSFEGHEIRSDVLAGLATERNLELDPVSITLVPHLDAVYEEMMKLVSLRQEDGHKWVNPALYGRWVSSGFASVFADLAQTLVSDHVDFVRRFYASHDPKYNEGHPLMYPNPVGICVTNGHGDYLGPHAVTIQRVDQDPEGLLRIYFYNPNNEGRQDWGMEVKPTVEGNGEREGESSLPFDQFASRLYAFHYNPYEEGDAYAVPEPVIERVGQAARESWGRSFTWSE